MSENKDQGDEKPTISPTNHDQNYGQRGGTSRREHTEEPNTGMRVGSEGNKTQGDDLEEIIPGKGNDRARRGADTFDIEGERVNRRTSSQDEAEGDVEGGPRGVETFDIEGERMPRGSRGSDNRDKRGPK